MLRLFFHCLVSLLPWWIKNPLYRHVCRYHIGRDVRIGLSPVVVGRCRIEDHTRIGHLNFFFKTEELHIEDHVRIGHLNLFRGGNLVRLGSYAEVLRANVVNSILDPEVENQTVPEFRLGAGSIITTGHWIDFTDAVTFGCRSILGGRHSSIWTHSRQWTRPVSIGSYVYLGSEVRLAPGAVVPPVSVVGLGSVIIDRQVECRHLIAGNPARAQKRLDAQGMRLLVTKTRNDLPEEIGADELKRLEASWVVPSPEAAVGVGQ